jgi:molybdopterin converting factor small subunit
MNVKVSVKFFAHFRRIVGADQLSVNLDGDTTMAGLLNTLTEQFDNPAFRDDAAVAIVNQTKAGPETVLKNGDSVLLLPVPGGG